MKTSSISKLCALLSLIASMVLPFHTAHANLMITPTRVVFDDKTKSGVVTLLNSTKKTKTYRIELVNKLQNSAGEYVDISADASYPGKSAVDFLRYSPRVVTIEPGKYQKIKLRLRMPAALPEGEYRTHLAMRVIDNDVQLPDSSASSNDDGMRAAIIPRVSFSIPLIVRHGETGLQTEIKNVELLKPEDAKAKPRLAVEIARSGNSSSFGLMNAYMKAPNSNQVQKIGQLNNVAVFTEIDSRLVRIPLWVDKIPNNAIVQVMYEGEDEYEGRTLGQAAFRFNQ